MALGAAARPQRRAPAGRSADSSPARDHAGRSHRPGAQAQPFAAGGAHHDPAKPGAGNHGQPAAQSDAERRHAVSAALSRPAISPPITLTTTRNSTWASATSSSAAKKRQHRLQAAKDQTAVTTAQVADNERTLTFNVASQFIAALLAQSESGVGRHGSGKFPADRGHQPGAHPRPAR